jgi:hypothetical protein
VPASLQSRLSLLLLISAAIFFIGFIPCAFAQDDSSDLPLGDIARNFRKAPVPSASEVVIDNDNLSKVMDDAESKRAGLFSMFSLDKPGNSSRNSSADVTCSLSFTASSFSPLSDSAMLNELPQAELAKLDGPANIDGDSLQVTVHNGSAWELHEVLIGLTIVKRSSLTPDVSYLGSAKIVPAVAGASETPQESAEKLPDTTLLLRVRGSAAPSATAVFRTSLNFELFSDQEWHWAIVKAKGIPPQVPIEALTKQPDQPSAVVSTTVEDLAPQTTPPNAVSTRPSFTLPILSSAPAPDAHTLNSTIR